MSCSEVSCLSLCKHLKRVCADSWLSSLSLLILFCRLVEGGNLYDHMSSIDSHSPVDKEKQVLVVAAQLLDISHLLPAVTKAYVYVTYDAHIAEKSLLQTLLQLHVVKLCHLDVSPGNVMLQWYSDHPWDTLRLVDFGFAKQFETGTSCCGHNCWKSKVAFVRIQQLLSRQLVVFKTALQSISALQLH